MTNNELLEIAKIIERKILNDNVIVVEKFAYNNLPYEDKMLSIEDRENLLTSIIDAINNGKDLNNILDKDMSKYTLTDLNDYLIMIKKARKTPVSGYISMLAFSDINKDLLNYVNYFLETHNYIENIEMKIAFLKKCEYKNVNELSFDDIDKVFFDYCNQISMNMKGR
jgi:hypothetical protein